MNQEAIRGTHRAKMKAGTQEKHREAMGDDEHTAEYKKFIGKDAGTLRRSTTDNRFQALQFESTEREDKIFKPTDEHLKVARTSLELMETELLQQLEALREFKAASATPGADKIKEKDLENERTLENDDMDVEEAGSEKALREKGLKMRRQSSAKLWKSGRPATTARIEAYDMEADTIQGHLDKRRKI